MKKIISSINGYDFAKMFLAGAYELKNQVNTINNLNVFPVPDGDTGTNMNLTLISGLEELRKIKSSHIGEVANVISKGLLLGARGNSGVILSQLFRGFAKSISNEQSISPKQFVDALQQGVESAYKAVMKPVEGTILTVAREAVEHVKSNPNLEDIFLITQELYEKASISLSQTPEHLPILKQVGVVDAGGKGLLTIYQGYLKALQSELEFTEFESLYASAETSTQIQGITDEHSFSHSPAQIHLTTDDIEFGYCTEFMLLLDSEKIKTNPFEESLLRDQLLHYGDSLVVVADDEWVKVHIHAEFPGEVMNLAMKFGSLSRIKIENMRDQHSKIIQDTAMQNNNSSTDSLINNSLHVQHTVQKQFGYVSVVSGNGISEIFKSLGVDFIVSGGQSMNPSIEEILYAIKQIHAEHIFILPNNSNIILAAQQARDLTIDKHVYVVPSKTIPQGISAMIAAKEEADPSTNFSSMTRAIDTVKSGQITVAVRDSHIDGIEIKKGSFIGIQDGKIVTSEKALHEAGQKLLQYMISRDDSLITLLAGEGADSKITEELVHFIQGTFPNLEVEVHEGGQSVYPYLVAVE